MTEISSLMNEPVTIEGVESLSSAIAKLLSKQISRLLVTESGSHVGIITEKDIGNFLLGDDSEKNLDDIPVSKIMKKIVLVPASSTVPECAKVMLEKNIGSLGVSADNKLVAGIITKTDLARYYAENYSGKHRVGDVMTISYIRQSSDDSLKDVVSAMVANRISRIFIQDNNNIEGIITFRDLFRIALEQGNTDSVLDNSDPVISVVFTRKGFLSESGFGNTMHASDIMTKNIESVDFEEDLVIACKAMIQEKINGVGVRIENKLGGIVSKTDVLKAIFIDGNSQ